MSKSEILASSQADRLATLVEEATRATTEAPRRFVEPARGTLDRAKSKRHHLVFGRRGSGKTSLLRKAGADLSLDRTPIAFVDLEAFKSHSYPDVLLSVLIATFHALDSWLETAGTHPASRVSFWKRLFGAKPRKPPIRRQQVTELRSQLSEHIGHLETVLHSADDAEVAVKHTTGVEATAAAEVSGGAKTKAVHVDGKLGASGRASAASEVTESARRSKIDFLHRHILDYQKLFDEVVAASGESAYIFLDDLYHIRRHDQPSLLDYFHRIVKGRSVWLKVGTIKHRTEWYHHGDPPIGVKLGDDADDIDLDITLEKYSVAKDFLLAILNQLVCEAGLQNYGEVLADGGVERLVLASGGVARDFLTIFRRAMEVARERGVDYRGERINAEDVNAAAGEHDSSKRDELKRDTIEERRQLESALVKIQDFCIEREVNCVLVERDRDTSGMRLIGELVDLRFLHLVESRLTVRDQPGKLYSAYMLDISQYTGARKRRELRMVRFWEREELDRLRRAKYVLEPEALMDDGAHEAIPVVASTE